MGVGPADWPGPHPYLLVCAHCAVFGRACQCERV